MTGISQNVLAARLDVRSVALQEVGRALSTAQAAQVAEAICLRVADSAVLPLTPAADEGLTGELVPLLVALQRGPAR